MTLKYMLKLTLSIGGDNTWSACSSADPSTVQQPGCRLAEFRREL